MNKLIFPLVGALLLGACASDAGVAVATGPKTCPPEPLILPLDHGPRAQTTPYLNRLRKERFEAEMKACKEQRQ